jgi:hypothetical protein
MGTIKFLTINVKIIIQTVVYWHISLDDNKLWNMGPLATLGARGFQVLKGNL